jgi:PIN domain nuclease of toxin-antitoxin system
MNSVAETPLLLDTHYWIWMESGDLDEVPQRLRLAVQQAAGAGALLLSVISVWEVGLLESKGRIELNSSCDMWVRFALATPGLELVPLTPEIAIDSTRFPESFHGDLADRIIMATAKRTKARLLTRDRKMREYAREVGVALV